VQFYNVNLKKKNPQMLTRFSCF